MTSVSSWHAETREVLRRAGFRTGGARTAVVDLLARQTCCASAQEIHQTLHELGRSVGVASVYRALDLLHELRRVQRVDVGDGITRFEPASADGDHHHHVVCDDCGKVEPFSDPSLELAIAHASGRLNFSVGAHEVVLRGECDECRTPSAR